MVELPGLPKALEIKLRTQGDIRDNSIQIYQLRFPAKELPEE